MSKTADTYNENNPDLKNFKSWVTTSTRPIRSRNSLLLSLKSLRTIFTVEMFTGGLVKNDRLGIASIDATRYCLLIFLKTGFTPPKIPWRY